MAKKLNVRPSDVIDMQQRLGARDFSLEAPIGDGTSTHLESIASGCEPQDEELVRSQEEALVARRIADAIGRLDARERHIVKARIMGDGKETLRDLGKHFGFSRERARQLEIRGLQKLRRELRTLADKVGWQASSGNHEGP
jgi:RNA polymerase sigma-32 factor